MNDVDSQIQNRTEEMNCLPLQCTVMKTAEVQRNENAETRAERGESVVGRQCRRFGEIRNYIPIKKIRLTSYRYQ